MKTVKALVAFSNGVISMEQYEVRSLPTDMANDLIAAGICVEAGGGSGGGVLVVHADENRTLDKTWQEIHDNPVAVILDDTGRRLFVSKTHINGPTSYVVLASSGDGISAFVAQSASGYPTYTDK